LRFGARIFIANSPVCVPSLLLFLSLEKRAIMTNRSIYGLEHHGFDNLQAEYWNLSTAALCEQVIRHSEGIISHLGPVVVNTGQHTGRSPKDKFIVHEPQSAPLVWWGDVNREISHEQYVGLKKRMLDYFQGRSAFVLDCYAGQDEQYRLPIRIITSHAWQSLFARNLMVQPLFDALQHHVPEYTIIAAPSFDAVPAIDGTNSSTFIVVNFDERMVLIGGTRYAGEIKKSVFTIMNYLMPNKGVLSMHCSANIGNSPDDVAIFFGLSGTGKTTLSADASRMLIGDDEHGWSDNGIFNFEGGCYAKMINLDPEKEPEIYNTTRRFGTVLENVVINNITREIDVDDNSLTENTRAAYPLEFIPNAVARPVAGHPRNIFFLTADAFGVLPPISKLTPDQAQYHFLLGYTAKVAGTERGLGNEPQATFSACFGAPFLVHHPMKYAEMLSQKIEAHNCNVWLVNTGWTGGPYGVGQRMSLPHTRAMVNAALAGDLDHIPTYPHSIFHTQIPEHVPGVPNAILNPRDTWADPNAYDEAARQLARMFHQQFEKFQQHATIDIREAAPLIS
jgi:phosphoenolpyruvate carboxykinase (ATP)